LASTLRKHPVRDRFILFFTFNGRRMALDSRKDRIGGTGKIKLFPVAAGDQIPFVGKKRKAFFNL
jgi:hypothetical protein